MSLGQRIKSLRKSNGYTQRRLAQLAGVDFTYLSKIENDRLEHTPSIKALQQLANALDADELELITLADKMPAALRDIAQSREALQFFRKASKIAKCPNDWRTLTESLDDMLTGSASPDAEIRS